MECLNYHPFITSMTFAAPGPPVLFRVPSELYFLFHSISNCLFCALVSGMLEDDCPFPFGLNGSLLITGLVGVLVVVLVVGVGCDFCERII